MLAAIYGRSVKHKTIHWAIEVKVRKVLFNCLISADRYLSEANENV